MYDIDLIFSNDVITLERELKERLSLIQKYYIIKDLNITFPSEK